MIEYSREMWLCRVRAHFWAGFGYGWIAGWTLALVAVVLAHYYGGLW